MGPHRGHTPSSHHVTTQSSHRFTFRSVPLKRFPELTKSRTYQLVLNQGCFAVRHVYFDSLIRCGFLSTLGATGTSKPAPGRQRGSESGESERKSCRDSRSGPRCVSSPSTRESYGISFTTSPCPRPAESAL